MSKALDQHSMIQALKNLAIELNRTPSRDHFIKVCKISQNRITENFGSYATLIAAAGLEPNRRKGLDIDKTIFEVDIDAHLESYQAIELPEPSEYEETLFIPDVHFPFDHQATLNQIYAFAEKMKPKNIIQLGDLYDTYSHAKFPRSHNIFTPKDETKLARQKAQTFWSTLQKASPKSRCIQITGNHDVRPLKRILEVYPEAEEWILEAMNKLMAFDGVETIADARQELILPGNVVVMHGYRSNIGAHRDYMLQNSVCGHLHQGGVVYRQIRGQTLWELNAGLAGDPTAKGLSYTPQKIVHWTLGWGYLDRFGPRFIPATK